MSVAVVEAAKGMDGACEKDCLRRLSPEMREREREREGEGEKFYVEEKKLLPDWCVRVVGGKGSHSENSVGVLWLLRC